MNGLRWNDGVRNMDLWIATTNDVAEQNYWGQWSQQDPANSTSVSDERFVNQYFNNRIDNEAEQNEGVLNQDMDENQRNREHQEGEEPAVDSTGAVQENREEEAKDGRLNEREVAQPNNHANDAGPEILEAEVPAYAALTANDYFQATTENGELVTVLKTLAVTNGPGTGNYNLPGNRSFRELVRARYGEYLSLGQRYGEITRITRECIEAHLSRGGEFLKRDGHGGWLVMNADERHKKTGRIFRDTKQINIRSRAGPQAATRRAPRRRTGPQVVPV